MPTPKHGQIRPPDKWVNNALLPAYNLSLGRFIRQFGQTETTIAFHLREFVGLQVSPSGDHSDLLNALIGGKRIPELKTALQLIIQSENVKQNSKIKYDTKEFDVVFKQLSEIHFLRDRIAHYAVHPEFTREGIYMRTNNTYTVRDKNKSQEILFKIDHLDHAYYDLAAICYRVSRVLFPERKPDNWSDQNTTVNGEQIPLKIFYGPWRYKSSELKRTGRRY